MALDPNNVDTNGDCLNDGVEVGPDPENPRDTDGDGIIDALDPDNDGDGLLDCEEVAKGFDPGEDADILIQGSGEGLTLCGSVGADSSNAGGIWLILSNAATPWPKTLLGTVRQARTPVAGAGGTGRLGGCFG